MPIYDFKCSQCGEEFERLVLKGDVAECPECHSTKVEQMISSFAVSSDATRQANLKRARAAHAASKDLKDKRVAEHDEIREHAPHLFEKRPKDKNKP